MNCVKNKTPKILFFGILFAASISKGQIPASGSDLPSLSSVHWGMDRQEVKMQIGRDTEEIGDTAIAYQDSLKGSIVHVALTFGKADSEKGLKFVEVQFGEKNVEGLRSYLTTRYGNNYETERKEKTKLFFTVKLEASKWLLRNESITMMVFSHGDEVLALNLLYNRRGK